MPTKTAVFALGSLLLMANPGFARDPLTAIDWLKSAPPVANIPDTLLVEPPVAQSADGPEITVTPLERLVPPVGLVAQSQTGLPASLWHSDDHHS